jgi:hypothetical protein
MQNSQNFPDLFWGMAKLRKATVLFASSPRGTRRATAGFPLQSLALARSSFIVH